MLSYSPFLAVMQPVFEILCDSVILLTITSYRWNLGLGSLSMAELFVVVEFQLP